MNTHKHNLILIVHNYLVNLTTHLSVLNWVEFILYNLSETLARTLLEFSERTLSTCSTQIVFPRGVSVVPQICFNR